MSKIATDSGPRALAYLAIFIAVIVSIALFNWTYRTQPSQQAVVRGHLVEQSEIKVGKRGKLLRFTISEFQGEFRIDPSIVRDLMNGQVPKGFAPGAEIEISADATEIASPDHPLLKPSLSIVWVNGLAIEGHRQFDVADVVEHEKQDSIWLILLLGLPLAMFGYLVMVWRRGRQHHVG